MQQFLPFKASCLMLLLLTSIFPASAQTLNTDKNTVITWPLQQSGVKRAYAKFAHAETQSLQADPGISNAGNTYYVNDPSIAGDRYTSAPGNDLSPGSALLPFLFNGTGSDPSAAGFQPVVNSYGDSVAPSVPTNLRVVYTGRNLVNLDWDNSTDNVGVAGYDIYADGALLYTSTTSNVTAAGLLPNTTYTQAGWLGTSLTTGIGTPGTGPSGSGIIGDYTYPKQTYRLLNNYTSVESIIRGIPGHTTQWIYENEISNFIALFDKKKNGIVAVEVGANDIVSFDSVSTIYSYIVKIHEALRNAGIATVLVPIVNRMDKNSSGFTTGKRNEINTLLVSNWRKFANGISYMDSAMYNDNAPLNDANFTRNDVDGFSQVHWSGNGAGIQASSVAQSMNKIIQLNQMPAKIYSFTVRARDLSGNSSAQSAPVSVTTVNSGLDYRFYQGTFDALPNFNTLPVVQSGHTPNVDISVRPAGINDNFAFVWQGYIAIKKPGAYTFETVSDDGSKLYFNTFYSPSANALVNNDGLHGPVSATGTVNIADTGLYPIAITFFEKNLGESMQVFWSGPGFARQQIPNSAFSDDPRPAFDTTAPSIPANLHVASADNTSVTLDWDNAAGNMGATTYDVYVNGVKKYTSPTSDVLVDSLGSNNTYTFTVKARDFAGNTSGFSAPVNATTSGVQKGINYKYYEGTFATLPDFSKLTPNKTGATPNIDITARRAGVNDNFAFLWEGYIKIPVTGNYIFETISDDGSKLYFNNTYNNATTATVNNDGLHAPASVKSVPQNVAAGVYPIAITFFENNQGETMQAYWTKPDNTRELIPDSMLLTINPGQTDSTPPSVPANVRIFSTGGNFITLGWNSATDNIGVTGYEVFVNDVKRVTTNQNQAAVENLNPSTTYSVKVRALDGAGNASAVSTAINVTTKGVTLGLSYRYYQGAFSTLPDFNALTPVKTGVTPNINVSVRNPGVNDNYAFVWEGYITVTTPGNYIFETVSDDGSKVYYNSFYFANANALVNNDNVHGPASAPGTVNLPTAGTYPISITYFEKDGGETMKFYWTGPGFSRSIVPDSVFRSGSDNTPPTAPGNLKVLYTSRGFVNLDWNNSTDAGGVTAYDVYVNGTKAYTVSESAVTASGLNPNTTYTFLVRARDLAGNTSDPSNTVNGTTSTTSDGLKYRYYDSSFDVLPNLNTLTPVKTGSSANVDIAQRNAGANDNFAFVWEGYINITVAGNYVFETISDDGSKLYFNNVYVPGAVATVDNDGLHAPRSVTNSINIPAPGIYPISFTFFEKGGGETMQAYWTRPGALREAIPNNAFVEGAGPVTIFTPDGAGKPNAPKPVSETVILKSAYPNPFVDRFTLYLNNNAAASDISVNVYDLRGKLVYLHHTGKVAAGTMSMTVDLASAHLAEGTYMVHLNVNGMQSRVIKLVKMKE